MCFVLFMLWDMENMSRDNIMVYCSTNGSMIILRACSWS